MLAAEEEGRETEGGRGGEREDWECSDEEGLEVRGDVGTGLGRTSSTNIVSSWEGRLGETGLRGMSTSKRKKVSRRDI